MSTTPPETLVKYCTPSAAIPILSSQTLRWSAPHEFADPFELHHQTVIHFDPQTLLQAAIKTAAALIFGKEVPRGAAPIMAAIRRWREEERFSSADEADVVLTELLSRVVNQRQIGLDQIMMDWRKFARTLRIASFCQKPDNLMAWQHFADHHHGIAIRFKCGESTTFSNPRKVEYSNVRPEITTLAEQLDSILNHTKIQPQDNFLEKFTVKPSICNSEHEWRCFLQVPVDLSNAASPNQLWHSDIKFERHEISAVYLGALTDPKLKREIYDLLKQQYNQAKLFQAKTTNGKYEIEFERIQTG